jgi:glycosyltransferase involved in cell wall biosynthesis
MRRIIVDCTHTFHTGAGTGIQRVVRQYADALLAIASDADVEVLAVRVQGDSFVPLPVADGRVAFPRAAMARESVQAQSASPGIVALRNALTLANRILHSDRLESFLHGGPNEAGITRILATRSEAAPAANAFRAQAADIVLSLDSSWVYDIRTALDAAGRAGATRVAVLCDVLPVSDPQWFTEGTRRWFRGWLEVMMPRLEGVVAISRASCEALHGAVDAGKLRLSTLPPCTAVHLGAEIGEASPTGEVRPALARSLEGEPAFLTVGTLEPRKNVGYAVDLFDALLARGLGVQWHIVGSPGWLAEDVAARIRTHPEYGTRLHWWTDLTDGELHECYRRAAALVAVSRAEGFGLPLVEARLQGLPVFASDIPVFREILGEEACYLPLDRPALAAAAIEDFLAGRAVVPRGPSRIARSWQDAARELLQTVLRIDAERRGQAASRI